MQLTPCDIECQGHVYVASPRPRNEEIGIAMTSGLFIPDDELDVVCAEGLNCIDGSPDTGVEHFLNIAILIEVVYLELYRTSEGEGAYWVVEDSKEWTIERNCRVKNGGRNREVCGDYIVGKGKMWSRMIREGIHGKWISAMCWFRLQGRCVAGDLYMPTGTQTYQKRKGDRQTLYLIDMGKSSLLANTLITLKCEKLYHRSLKDLC